MPVLYLETFISAPVQACFDASRNLDLHQNSMAHTREKAVGGKTTGLVESGDEVIWEAVHFGVRQKLRVKIGRMDSPYFFEDYMLKGAFASMHHEHRFEEAEGGTRMLDVFRFKAPLGLLGRLAEQIFLTAYMKRLLEIRNRFLKEHLENGGSVWVLP